MALYSVWDWNRNSYRVYSTTSPVSVGDDPVPPRPTGTHVLGADPDADVKPLPSGVRLIGRSHLPKGEIRRAPRGLGDNGDDAGNSNGAGSGLAMLGLGIAVGAGVMWWVGRKR
jgi:hypothetical protein